jgi:hypothetical protein
MRADPTPTPGRNHPEKTHIHAGRALRLSYVIRSSEWLDLERATATGRWYSDSYEQVSRRGTVGCAQIRIPRRLERNQTLGNNFDSVLELGRSWGELTPYLRHSFVRQVGRDLSDELSQEEKSRLVQRGLTLTIADRLHLSAPHAPFHRALNTCVPHHVADGGGSLQSMRRVPAPYGPSEVISPGDS